MYKLPSELGNLSDSKPIIDHRPSIIAHELITIQLATHESTSLRSHHGGWDWQSVLADEQAGLSQAVPGYSQYGSDPDPVYL